MQFTTLKRLDIFPKFDKKFERDARDKTTIGAFLSLGALVVMAILVFSEFAYFFSSEVKRELYVDPVVDGTIDIKLNVSFPHVPCDLITLDAVDYFGNFEENVHKNTVKHRIKKDLTPIDKARAITNSHKDPGPGFSKETASGKKSGCGSCYGAERGKQDCCNSCDDVKERYNDRGWSFDLNDVGIAQCAQERMEQAARLAAHEGCNIYSHLSVARVQGNIHFIPGKEITVNGMHLHDLGGEIIAKLNLSHTIHTLEFGDGFPGITNPLTNHNSAVVSEGNGKYQYFIKIVPTRYEDLTGMLSSSLETYQYSVTDFYTERKKSSRQQFVPGMFFLYDLSPIKVRVFEQRPYTSLTHFLLQLCAITGGVFTVAGLIDGLLYHQISRQRKAAMGKLS